MYQRAHVGNGNSEQRSTPDVEVLAVTASSVCSPGIAERCAGESIVSREEIRSHILLMVNDNFPKT
jgi:hypothetical protein